MASKAFAVGFVAIAGLMIFGCSSSSSNGATGDGGAGGTTSGNLCPKISATDIQALLAPPYAAVTENDTGPYLFECDSSGLQVELNTNDADKTDYNTVAVTDNDAGGAGHDVHALSGFGDEAYWWSIDDLSGNGTEDAVPSVSVHKGSATCYIGTDNDPSKYSMPYTSTAQFTITESDAAAWAAKGGKVCTDFFAAAGL